VQIGGAKARGLVYNILKLGVGIEVPVDSFALWRDRDAEFNPDEILANAR
jgi:hypothetical protein